MVTKKLLQSKFSGQSYLHSQNSSMAFFHGKVMMHIRPSVITATLWVKRFTFHDRWEVLTFILWTFENWKSELWFWRYDDTDFIKAIPSNEWFNLTKNMIFPLYSLLPPNLFKRNESILQHSCLIKVYLNTHVKLTASRNFLNCKKKKKGYYLIPKLNTFSQYIDMENILICLPQSGRTLISPLQ